MKNLAGNKECDIQIKHELTRCGIKIIHGERMDKEVPASITGKLGDITFMRSWCYWSVIGKIPLHVAEELYADPVGKEDIRVMGDSGYVAPKSKVAYFDAKGCKINDHRTEVRWSFIV